MTFGLFFLLFSSVVCYTKGAKADAALPFGMNFNPTVVLDLHEADHSETKCNTINGHELCTKIDYCPADAYQCSWIDPTNGHSCGLSTADCSCTATYGNQTCACDVTTDVPYRVAARVYCENVDWTVKNINSDCSDPAGFYYPEEVRSEALDSTYCARGRSTFSSTSSLFEVYWQCPKEEKQDASVQAMSLEGYRQNGLKPEEDCTCRARYGYQDCHSCHPCRKEDPGDFHVVCPGLFVDCYQTYSFWDDSAIGFRSGGASLPLPLILSMIILAGAVMLRNRVFG